MGTVLQCKNTPYIWNGHLHIKATTDASELHSDLKKKKKNSNNRIQNIQVLQAIHS